MKWKGLKVLFALFFLCIFISCDFTEDEEKSFYSFMIITQNAKFSGYYIVDGDMYNIDNNEIVQKGVTTYSLEKDLDNPTSISISVTGMADYTTTSCDIYVYENEKLVKEAHDSKSVGDDIVSINVYYEFGKTSTTTTTK